MNNAYKRWTEDMDNELKTLLSWGIQLEAIAFKMGRSKLAICLRVMHLHDRGELGMHPV